MKRLVKNVSFCLCAAVCAILFGACNDNDDYYIYLKDSSQVQQIIAPQNKIHFILFLSDKNINTFFWYYYPIIKLQYKRDNERDDER